MKRNLKWTVLAGGAACVLAAGFVGGRAWAGGIPAKGALTYSGVLQKPDGSPLTSSGHNLEIKLWSTGPTGGTALCDTTVAAPTFTLDNSGRFSVQLDDACTGAIGANAGAFVEILLDGNTLGRTKLGAVPYAIEATHAVNADSAANATVAATANAATHAVNADSAANATVAATANAAGGALQTTLSNLQTTVSTIQRLEAFHVYCNNSGSTVMASSGTAPAIANGTSVGTCSLQFPGSMWSSAPICTCSPAEGGVDADRKCQVGTELVSALQLAGFVSAAPAGLDLNVNCVGAR
jgi:hypothetical protein